MASQQELSQQGGEMVAEAQVKRDEILNKSNEQSAAQTATELKDQAANFIQQTGEQVKNMAQGATEAVKNTLGMNTDNASSPATATATATATNPANAPSQ